LVFIPWSFGIGKNSKSFILYVKKFQKHAIFTHDLLRLVNKVDLQVNEKQEEWLDEITTFNINSRYDNYKQNFNKLCTKEFTTKWINRTSELRQWLIKQL
jgi:HEPN domain-containing protein